MAPRVSFIVPAYNAERYLESAVRSACRQTVSDIEIVIVDDGSHDGTAGLAARLCAEDDRVRCVATGANRGPSAARNLGVREARGAWIAVLDADDTIAPGRAARLLELAAATSADIVSDNLVLQNETTGTSRTGLRSDCLAYGMLVTPSDYLHHNRILTGGLQLGYLKPMYRSGFLRREQLSYDEGIWIAEDFDFCLRALLAGARYAITSEPLYTYVIRSGSLSSRLTRTAVETLIERSHALQQRYGGMDQDQREAFGIYDHYLSRARSFALFVENLKAGRVLDAARIAYEAPAIWGLIARNGPEAFAKRARRLRVNRRMRMRHTVRLT